MGYSVIIYNEAKQDITEIVKWYDVKSAVVSSRFILQLDEAINKISKPLMRFRIYIMM